jgi:hypothetical protein
MRRLVLASALALLGAGARIQAQSITGVITEGDSKLPVAGVVVRVGGTQLGASSGDDGRFTIARVPPGTYAVTARRLGYRPETQTVVVAANQAATANFASPRRQRSSSRW